LLKRYNIKVDGRRAVIVGASNLIGKPMSLLLTRHWATVTICDMRTKPLSEMTRQADILVSVTGVAHLITGDMVKPGAVVLDFGFARLGDKWVGDVDFEAVKEIAGAITPVPGGTGPMTNAMLMRNTMTAAERQVRLGLKAASQISAVGPFVCLGCQRALAGWQAGPGGSVKVSMGVSRSRWRLWHDHIEAVWLTVPVDDPTEGTIGPLAAAGRPAPGRDHSPCAPGERMRGRVGIAL